MWLTAQLILKRLMAISIYSLVVCIAALVARIHAYVRNKRLRIAEVRRRELLRGVVLRWAEDGKPDSDEREGVIEELEQAIPEGA